MDNLPDFFWNPSLSHGLWNNIQNHITPKLLELESCPLERMFTPQYVSHVTCYVSSVTCHMSCVTCHMTCVTCHMSHVTFHMSSVTFFFNEKKLRRRKKYEKIRQRGRPSPWRVCDQRGLPRLVFETTIEL